MLAPIIKREITYRLLVGNQGERLRQMAAEESQGQQIARAIDWLKSHFAQTLRIDDLAAQHHMSPSTFHHHFRALTAMSPLQYQKWLRLNEARRLMRTERSDAATAAHQVGYESPSQFSREYRRLFGAPPYAISQACAKQRDRPAIDDRWQVRRVLGCGIRNEGSSRALA